MKALKPFFSVKTKLQNNGKAKVDTPGKSFPDTISTNKVRLSVGVDGGLQRPCQGHRMKRSHYVRVCS